MMPMETRFTTRTMMVMNVGKNTMPRETRFTTRTVMVVKNGGTPMETAFIYGTMMVKNGSVMTTKQERFADKEKKNPSSMSFIVSFRGDLQYEGTLNLNDGTISIFLAYFL